MSKTMFVTVIALCVLLFTSCGAKKPSVPSLDGDISVQGTLCVSGLEAKVSLSRADGVWTASFTSPESINGLELTISENKLGSKLDGISFELPTNTKGYENILCPIINAIDNAESYTDAKESGGVCTVIGTGEDGGWQITAASDGSIISVTASDISFAADEENKDTDN